MGTKVDRKIWVVSGPSSVGKTTFINSPRLHEITGLAGDFSVHVASSGSHPETGDVVVHYNIQRPLHQHLLSAGSRAPSDLLAAALDFAGEPAFAQLVSEPNVNVIVLAAERERLLHRVTRRPSIESPSEAYPVQSWIDRYRSVDVSAIYRAWLAELEGLGIPTVLVDARDRQFRRIDSSEQLLALVNGRAPSWTSEKIRQWSDPNRFQYQQVRLPDGRATPGTDRSATCDLVFKSPVADKSVLDVGSAEGYFSFEAEMRDAARVKGLEPMKDRYDLACGLKEIRGSRVEFEQRDVAVDPVDEDWDVILLLNVIHHLSDPVGVLQNLAVHAREELIVEFPTFADPRFRKHRRVRIPWFYNRRPLIGVSSLKKGVAQTLVFSPEAIRAIFLELDTPIRSVEFDRSPIPGRAIAHAFR